MRNGLMIMAFLFFPTFFNEICALDIFVLLVSLFAILPASTRTQNKVMFLFQMYYF